MNHVAHPQTLSSTDLAAFWSGRPYHMTADEARDLIQRYRAESFRGDRKQTWLVCHAKFVGGLRNELADMDPTDAAFFKSALRQAGICIDGHQLDQVAQLH